ncbi:phenylalanine--tRNA ligase subunit alpha [bacterium]|nr:phenylalanine--tRNA ligase subunit alpha [bacterium]|tara:strand:+ start:223 stop:1245 length:1023 start_codon:yes stop_codon:yes gene_type:complete
MDINKLKKQAIADLENVASESALEQMRLKYLGRKQGKLTAVLRGLKNIKSTEKAKVGKQTNIFKNKLLELIQQKKNKLANAQDHSSFTSSIDITAPGKKPETGHLHIITQVLQDIQNIFSSMGFSIAQGPDIEDDFHNFTALNLPEDHPARSMWDTFYIKSKNKLLLRCHTSPVQIRHMENNQPPLRIIAPGRCFRYESIDATHDIQFYQVEGLMIDKNISISNFKGIISEFFKRFYGKETKIRLRPSYFPFVEPGFEIDISCIFCHGKGCKVCKKTGFMEIMGAGMVHPNVFRAVGYNVKDNWQGFAFGMGVERLAMPKYKINDIRLFYENDIRFLRQF